MSQKILLLCIGSIKTSWIREACSDYADRLDPLLDLEILELPASKEKDPDRQRNDECERVLKTLEKKQGVIWVLDECGKERTSEQFASDLSTAKDLGDSVIIVLGGAYGLNDAIRSRGKRILRLSAMTFPHELCRVVLLEQLFRATQIQRGSGYHH